MYILKCAQQLRYSVNNDRYKLQLLIVTYQSSRNIIMVITDDAKNKFAIYVTRKKKAHTI